MPLTHLWPSSLTGPGSSGDPYVLDITGRFPRGQLLSALRPATFPGLNGNPNVELYLDRDAFPQVFAAGLPYRQAAAAAAAQRPISAAALEEKSRAAAWKTAPSRYLIATADQIIPPQAQQFMAQRGRAHRQDPRLARHHADPPGRSSRTDAASAASQIWPDKPA